MNKLDLDYQNLLKDILENGMEKKDRTGTGTISVFGRQIRHKMSDGFPIITTKKMAFKTIVTELLWFLNGRTDLRWLLERNNTIWVGDAMKNYEKHNGKIECGPFITEQEWFINEVLTNDEFSEKWGALGNIYGHQWRSWNGIDWESFLNSDNLDEKDRDARHGLFYKESEIDQITKLINDLKNNPDDRGLIVSAWNVGDLSNMVLRPCHNFFQVYTRELTDKERYDIWFVNNYETGMERYFDPNKLPDFDNPYYEPTPKRAISLMWNQRSGDFPLGIPFNISSYGLLLEIIAKVVNMVPDELIGNFGDSHIYLNQIDGIKEQLKRLPYDLPKLILNTEFWPTKTHECGEGDFTDNIDFLIKGIQPDDFQLQNYQAHPKIFYPLSN